LFALFVCFAAIIFSSFGLRSVNHKGLAVTGLVLGIIFFLFTGAVVLVIGILAWDMFE